MSATKTALTLDQTRDVLLERLKDAAAAHGIHEATVLEGRYDEEWPEWYTDHIITALADGGYSILGPPS